MFLAQIGGAIRPPHRDAVADGKRGCDMGADAAAGHALDVEFQNRVVRSTTHRIIARRLALKGTEWAQAQVDTIRLKLFKIGAIVRLSVRRVLLQLSSGYPWKDIYAAAFHALRC